jgi:hypothetical protein
MADRRIFIGLLVFLFFTCTPQGPKDVLTPDKMSDIITDLQLADAAYKLDMLPAAYKNHPEKYYLEILASHQTDSATYNRSLKFYAGEPKLLKLIYKKVEINIQQKANTR